MRLNMRDERSKFQRDFKQVACYPYTQEVQGFTLSLYPTEFPLRHLLMQR